MITDIASNKTFQAVVKELFFWCRKLNILLVCFITQSYLFVPKDIGLNPTNYLIRKTNNNRELRNITISNSVHLYYKDFVKIYIECTQNCIPF